MLLFVTGGCGFIGTNFIRLALAECPDSEILNFDKLTYAGNPANLEDIATKHGGTRYHFVLADVNDAHVLQEVLTSRPFDAVIHFAAESHVDRSISDASPFILTNILGTQTLLDATRAARIPRYVQISTDEVYGSLGAKGLFKETTPIAPNSPYSASKASADLLVRAAHETYGMDTVITRCSNNYGPYQFPEKLVPLMIRRALKDESLPVYGDGMQVRDWIHVEDHCRGILLALQKGRSGGVYNFGGHAERPNLAVIREILRLLNKPETLIRSVEDRPGHDRRYAMDFSLAASELGYAPKWTFEEGLAATVRWYLHNTDWVENVISGAYMDFMRQWYDARLAVAESASATPCESVKTKVSVEETSSSEQTSQDEAVRAADLSVLSEGPKKPQIGLVLGGKGLLGQALLERLTKCGWEAHSLSRDDCDLLSPRELAPHVERIAPDVLFNTAAWTQVDAAEDHPQEALTVNRGLPALLGSLLKGSSTRLVHYSTDFVFNGRKECPYTEIDRPEPMSVYGSSKLAGEQALLEMGLENCCIIRTAWLFGPGRRNFVSALLEQAAHKEEVRVVHDQTGSPTYAPDLAQASIQLAMCGASGLYHVVNSGHATWCELAAEAVRQAGLPCLVRAIPSSEWPQKARRPRYSILSTDKYALQIGSPLRAWLPALRDYVYNLQLSSAKEPR